MSAVTKFRVKRQNCSFRRICDIPDRLKMRTFLLILRPEILISSALFSKNNFTDKFPKELEYKKSYKDFVKNL